MNKSYITLNNVLFSNYFKLNNYKDEYNTNELKYFFTRIFNIPHKTYQYLNLSHHYIILLSPKKTQDIIVRIYLEIQDIF